MQPKVLEAIIDAINLQGEKVSLIWHAGEPLAAGKYLKSAIELVDNRCNGLVSHYIQTNGTLIDDDWCNFFINRRVRIGLSIDGPEWANTHRVDKKKQPFFSKIVRGAELLNKYKIPYTVIAVISDQNVEHAKELYDFFKELGCVDIGINFVELEKAEDLAGHMDDQRSDHFWDELFSSWSEDRSVSVREFRKIFEYFAKILGGKDLTFVRDPFPTIDVEGNVYLISPELAGKKSAHYNDFIAGNVLQESLSQILARAEEVPYMADFLHSVELCYNTCPLFYPCKGGYPINKFFEGGGDIASTTETSSCRNALIKPAEAILRVLERDKTHG